MLNEVKHLALGLKGQETLRDSSVATLCQNDTPGLIPLDVSLIL